MYRNNNKVFAPFQFKSPGAQELISETPGDPAEVPVMRRKKWPLLVLLLILLIVAVCTLPWGTRLQLTMSGAEIDPNGTVIADGEFVLKGTLYDYLLRDDQFKLLGIQVPNREINTPIAQASPVENDASGLMYTGVFFLELPEYDSDNNLYTGRLIWAENRSWFVLEVTGRIFVGSADANPDYTKILDLCRPFLMLYPE